MKFRIKEYIGKLNAGFASFCACKKKKIANSKIAAFFSRSGKKNEKVPKEIVEFQPDALEIKNQKLPFAIRFFIWFPLVVLILALVWSITCKTDVIVQCRGKLVTNLPTIVMKPLERSVIKKIDVKIGDIVKKGQTLITFEPEFNQADATRLQNEIIALRAQFARLQAEFLETDFVGSDEQFSRWQMAIFIQHKAYYKEKLNYFAETLNQIDASKKSKQDTLEKQKERLKSIQQLESMYRALHDKKAVSLKDLIQMSITRMEMEATVDQLANTLLELDHRKGTTTAEKNSFIQEWRNKISEEMVSVERNLNSTLKEYDKQQQFMKYISLKAPCNAVVHEIAAFSPGSAVREAEALITLIPLDGKVELEVEIRPEDIGKINIFAMARIKLSAYPFQKYGTLKGQVRNISEDTLERTEAGHTLKYYRGRIVIFGETEQQKKLFRLIPGMEAQCEIKCGKRRLIEYVLYPLIKALDEVAKEP